MRFYRDAHTYYCGIDLHARTMYLCLIDQHGSVLLEQNLPCEAAAFLLAVAPCKQDLVVTAECVFCWYWLADLCAQHGIPFVLAHALYLKAIHGAKAKNDAVVASKLAMLLRGGVIPMAYVYPPAMRAARDLMRRRLFFTRKHAELFSHIQNTFHQYNQSKPPGEMKVRPAPLHAARPLQRSRVSCCQNRRSPELQRATLATKPSRGQFFGVLSVGRIDTYRSAERELVQRCLNRRKQLQKVLELLASSAQNDHSQCE
jgi:hypothetical protein